MRICADAADRGTAIARYGDENCTRRYAVSQKSDKQPDVEHPQPAQHSDDARSRMPERRDDGHKQSSGDKPSRKAEEGEPPVG